MYISEDDGSVFTKYFAWVFHKFDTFKAVLLHISLANLDKHCLNIGLKNYSELKLTGPISQINAGAAFTSRGKEDVYFDWFQLT